jgi:arylsulfatase A-like enzyme
MRSYKWRKEPLIDEDRLTIAGVLKNGGYRTGMVGKWHLGFDYSDLNDLRGGPVDRGFDYYFGISRSLDQGDYYYIENRRAVQPPTESVEGSPGHGRHGWQGPFWRAGKAGKDFKHEQVLSMFIQKSIDFIEGAAEGSDPFFLYLALASPHTPWLISEEFRGTSEIGDWGDWVAENDHAIGKVLQALYDQGLRENTLIFFTSDNGPIWWPEDTKTSGHSATSVYRGMKFDVWEGGHRMPFIASWPGVVEAGSTSEQMISNTDMLATFADLVGETLPIDAGEDSYSFLNALYGSDGGRPIRETLVGQALDVRPDRDMLYIRQGDWKLMRTVIGKKLLYNLSEDPSETTNMYKENKAKGRELKQLLKKYRRSARSTPGRGE